MIIKMSMYDTIIIGAGIAGATLAHTLTQQNKKVLVVDKNGIASGGSGAAGAFVSPKIGLASPLHSLTNEAFEVAKDFYMGHCPQYFTQTGVLRIPKDDTDAEKFPLYEKANTNKYEKYDAQKLNTLGINASYEGFYFPDAGDCDASAVCHFLLKDIEVTIAEVLGIEQKETMWQLLTPHSSLLTKHIVIATGYENTLFNMDYMGVHGIWGNRTDFSTSLDLPISMHQSMSVGANVGGTIKLGATHERRVEETKPCEESEAKHLKDMASSLVDTSDFELQKIYCGMRAGSRDSFPLVGKVVDVQSMLEEHPSIKKGRMFPLKYIDNLYIYNGLGGRGFVFAPLMAKMLAENIVNNKEIDKRVNPDRLFWKWCRKL